MTQEEKRKRIEIIKKMARTTTNKEIAEHFGLSRGYIEKVCRGIKKEANLNFVNQYTTGEFDQIENVKGYILKANPEGDIEYVGGFTTLNKSIVVRCTICGTTFSRSMVTIRHGNKTRCPVCQPVKTYENKIARRRAHQKRRRERLKEKNKPEIERRKAERHERALANQAARVEQAKQKKEARRHDCPVCGKSTTRSKYCSDECMKKAGNSSKEARRRLKIKSQMVDRDITLKKLFDRDDGRCWICGMMCDYSDKIYTDKAMIAGDMYPSIDHVVPLSSGGAHSWDNVKLAHRICNSVRQNAPRGVA